MDFCTNKVFSGGKCLRHYRYEKYGVCSFSGCHSPACGTHGVCDNCMRRGEPKSRHIGKHINTATHKFCEACKEFKTRKDFYKDRGHSSYLCKKCQYKRSINAKRRAAAWNYGVLNVVQTSATLCVKCWQPLGKWEVDHIVPHSKGGTHEIDNLQIMCIPCNRKKSNNESIDYREFLDDQERDTL